MSLARAGACRVNHEVGRRAVSQPPSRALPRTPLRVSTGEVSAMIAGGVSANRCLRRGHPPMGPFFFFFFFEKQVKAASL